MIIEFLLILTWGDHKEMWRRDSFISNIKNIKRFVAYMTDCADETFLGA